MMPGGVDNREGRRHPREEIRGWRRYRRREDKVHVTEFKI
jgi:hypothetical protein